MSEAVVNVRVVAVHLVCDLCGATARLLTPPGTEDLEQFITGPGSLWMSSHRWPQVDTVEMLADGEHIILDRCAIT